MSKVIKRKCVICGVDLTVIVSKEGKYTGGHYFFGKKDGEKNEYWECDSCFVDKPQERIEE